MTKIIDIKDTISHSKKSDFAKYLAEQSDESHDLVPAHFCVLAAGYSLCGGGFEYSHIGDKDRTSLLNFIGMLESAKSEALKKLEEIEYEDY